MPDILLFAKALLVAAVAAGCTMLAFEFILRPTARPRLRSVAWLTGLAAGIYAGCGVLDQWPRWPAPEDRDRFLAVLLPLALAVEGMIAWLPGGRSARLLRWSLCAAAAPILLYNSTYLANLSGPHSAEWSPPQAAVILLILAAALACEWGLLERFQERTTDFAAAPVLVVVSLAAAVTVMLSGYYRGGLLGLPVAGAITGATLACCARRPSATGAPLHPSNYLAVGVIGIFSVLLIGRFFGALPTVTAICLFVVPPLAWISEAPIVKSLPRRTRVAIRLAVVVVPLVVIVARAQIKFTEDFRKPASGTRSLSGAQPATERRAPEK